MKRSICVLLALLLCCVLLSAAAEPITEFTYINGVKCRQKQNILTYLFMGVDGNGPMQAVDTEAGEIAAQVDVLLLLVIDKAADTYAVIELDRDTMTDVHDLSVIDGADLGISREQIALAYTNGDGMERSCVNTVTAVRDLLQGIRIDHYMAANVDVAGVLNAAVGGVELPIEEDFSAYDPDMLPGRTMRLTDEQAITYIRARMGMEDSRNTTRMRRQESFLRAVKPLAAQRYAQDPSWVLDTVHSMEPYTVSDMTDKDYSYIGKAIHSNEFLGIYQPAGTGSVDENGWVTFEADADSITDIIIELFYNVVEE